MVLTPHVVTCLIGITHGLILALLFFNRMEGRGQVNKMFAALMVLTSIDLAFSLYFQSNLFLEWPHFIRFNSPLNYLHGPVLYLYVRALTDESFSFQRVHLLHFLPVLLRAAWSLDFYLLPGPEKIQWALGMLNNIPIESYVLGGVWQAQRLLYTILAVVLLWRCQNRHGRQVWWPMAMVVLFSLSWFAAFNRYLPLFGADFRFPRLVQVIILYAIAYVGMIRPQWFSLSSRASRKKYATSGLSLQRGEILHQQLLEMMHKDKPFLQHNLTLAKLAKRMGVNPQHLSQVVNQQAGLSFSDFINGYRVDWVKALLADPQKYALTLEALADEAGFNATSTFNAAFKKQTGTTPSAYRRALEKSEQPETQTT